MKSKRTQSKFKKMLQASSTRRKRLSSNLRKKTLWRQRSYVMSATAECY
ncbi:hypothetical protein [Photobacterium damselae]|nr:hypothetical protein [Photobacterium damselae]